MTKSTLLAVLAASTLAAGGALAQAPAGDAARGAQKVQMCQGCHGIEGWRTAFPEVYKVPRIAGQHPQYFVSALKAYRSGDRSPPVDARHRRLAVGPGHGRPRRVLRGARPDDRKGHQVMKTTATALLCAALAVALPAAAADVNAGAAKAKEVCAACHGMDGNSQQPDYPKLGGQHADYLAKSLRDYKSGARKNAIMAGFAAALTKQDIDNLAAYYAQQPRVVCSRY